MKTNRISIATPAKKILDKVERKSHNLNDHIEYQLQNLDRKIPENSTVKITAPKVLNWFVDTIKLSLFKDNKKKSSTRIFFPKKIPPELTQKTWDYFSLLEYNKKYVQLRKKVSKKIENFLDKIK